MQQKVPKSMPRNSSGSINKQSQERSFIQDTTATNLLVGLGDAGHKGVELALVGETVLDELVHGHLVSEEKKRVACVGGRGGRTGSGVCHRAWV